MGVVVRVVGISWGSHDCALVFLRRTEVPSRPTTWRCIIWGFSGLALYPFLHQQKNEEE